MFKKMFSITQNDGEGGEMGVEEGRKATGAEKKNRNETTEERGPVGREGRVGTREGYMSKV